MADRELYAKIVKALKKEKVAAYEKGEREHELSYAASNLLYRYSQPGCVAQPDTVGDVETIIRQAQLHKVKVTIKSGGHSYAGHSATNKGVLLDLKRMNEVTLEYEGGKPKYARIQTGARWGDVYRTLINGRHDKYVINGGRCPSVGVGGFILGGGLGPFTRSFGMGSDTLVEATIVTADGVSKTVRIEDKDNPEKQSESQLFWALRGGGAGNFGVVVEIKMAVQELRNKKVVAGRYTWYPFPPLSPDLPNREEVELARRNAFVTTMNKFYTADWPDALTIDSNWIREIKNGKNSLGIRFTVYYDGTEERFKELIEANIDNQTLRTELIRRSMLEPSTRFLHESLVLMWEEEARYSLPKPGENSYRLYSSYVFGNEAVEIGEITKLVTMLQEKFGEEFKNDTASFSVTYIHTGGAAKNRYDENETAYRWRKAVFHTYVTILWEDKWIEKQARQFLALVKWYLRPFSLEGRASFINFADSTLLPNTHEAAYYGSNLFKLREVKERWDHDGFFTWSQGVQFPQRPISAHSTVVMQESRVSPLNMPNAAKDIDEDDLPPDDGHGGLSWAQLELNEVQLNGAEADLGWGDYEAHGSDYITNFYR